MYKKDRENQRKKIYIEKNIKKKVFGVGIPEPVSQKCIGILSLIKNVMPMIHCLPQLLTPINGPLGK